MTIRIWQSGDDLLLIDGAAQITLSREDASDLIRALNATIGRKTYTRMTEQTKAEITRLYADGLSVAHICRELNLSNAAVYQWLHRSGQKTPRRMHRGRVSRSAA